VDRYNNDPKVRSLCLRIVEFGDIAREIGVSPLVTAVDIGDGERDTFARGRGQSTLAGRTRKADVALWRGRAVSDETEKIRRTPIDTSAYSH
jgi:hypothetical protein